MAINDPLNNQLAMLQLQMAALSRQQAPGARTKEAPGAATDMKAINKAMYDAYRKPINKALQKTMWPTMLLSMGVEWGPQLTAKAKQMGIGGAAPIIEKLMGPLGAASYLVPSVLSNLLRTKRLGYEKYVQPQLGAVGTAARTMDLYNMTRHMMRTIPYASALLMGNKELAKAIPRPENFMTGAATGAYGLAKTGAKAAAGAVDTATGGVISKGIKSAVETPVGQGAASALKKVFGGIDTHILSTLGSPMGISLALAGVHMGLSIMKSIKMARLFPTKKSVAKLSNEYSLTKQSAQIVAQIDALAQTGKVRPEQLTYLILKVIEFNTRATEQQIAGFRAEFISEMDFVRQEKEKGEDRFSEAYGREIEGEDDRSIISKIYDKIEGGIQTIMNKYNPFHQMSNFIVGLLHGKIVTPKGEMARIAKTYGFDNEKEMLREKAIEFGISTSQVRLLTTDSRSILRLAPTYEAKMLAILAAQYDIQRMIAAEALTIRKGMGFSESLLYTGVPKEGLIQDLIGALKKLDPTNLPVVNAAWNLLKLPFKMVRGAARRAQRAGDWMSRAYGFVREKMLGEEYIKLESPEELLKKAGLYKKPEERAFEFVGRGLPQSIETIRLTLLQQLEVQENIFNVLQRQLEISGYMYDYQTKQIELLVWDPIEARYVTMEEADKLKQSRERQLEVTGEEAFRKGPLGKFLQFLDVATKGFKKADDLDRALERMFGAERFLGRLEAGPQIEELNTMGRWKRFWKAGGLLGRPETYSTEKIAQTLIEKELAGIYTTHVKMPFSKEEAEFRRSLETLPESTMLKGLGAVGETILPGVGGGLFGLLLNALKRKAYVKREKEISTRTDIERQIEQFLENGLFEQTYAERLEEMTGGSVIGAKAGAGPGVGARLTGISKVDIQTDLLRNILTVLVKDAIKVDVVKIGERELSQIGTAGPFLPVGIRQEALTEIESISKYLDVNVTNWEELKKQIPDLDILFAGGKKFPIDVFGADEALRVHMVGEGGQSLVSRTPFVDINIASIGGKDISEGLIPVTVGEWKASVKDRRAIGGPVGSGPVMVGEDGPEVYIPHAAEGKDVGTGTILPNNITELLKDVVKAVKESSIILRQMLNIQTMQVEVAKTETILSGNIISELKTQEDKNIDALNQMLGIQSEELEVVKKEAEGQEEYWSKMFRIAEEDHDRTLKKELDEVKDKKEKQEVKETQTGILATLKGIYGNTKQKIFGAKKGDEKGGGLFDWIAGNLGKILAGLGIGVFAGGLLSILKDFIFGKDVKLGDVLNKIFFSDDKDSLMGTLKNAGKLAAIGAVIGMIGGPLGMIAGGLLGGAIGAILQSLKIDSEDNTKSLVEKIGSYFFGSSEGGVQSAFKTGGTWAITGAVAGFTIGGPIGAFIGGVLGTIVGSLVGYFGIEKVVNFMKELGPNKYIIDLIDGGYAKKFAEAGSIIPIVGPIIGGFIGGIIDVAMPIVEAVSNAGKFIKQKIKEYFPTFYKWLFEGKDYKETMAEAVKEGRAVTAQQVYDIKNLQQMSDEDLMYQGFSQQEIADIRAGKQPSLQANVKTKAVPKAASATQAGEAGTKTPTGEVRSTVQIGEPAKVAASLEGQIPKATQAGAAGTKPPTGEAGTKPPTGEAGTKPPTGEVRSTVQIGEPAKVAAPLEGQIPKAAQAGIPIDKEKMDKELSQTIPLPSTNVGEALKEASQKTGEPLDTLTRVAYVESKLNPSAQAKGSSAKGLFQFITDTWKEMTSKFGSKYGISPETSPFDARANALMGGEFLKRNEQAIARTAPNHPPSAADLYIAHFLGAGGANEFFKQLRKDPNQVAADVFPKAAASNPNIFYVDGNKNQPRTLAQVYELMGKKMKVNTTSVLASITPKYEGVKEEVAQSAAVPRAAEYEPTEKEIEDYMFEARKTEKILTKEEAKKELIDAKKAEKDREARTKPPTGEVRSTVQIGEPAKVAASLEGQIPKATQAGEAGTKPPTGEVRSTVQIGEPAKVAAPLEGQIPKAAQSGADDTSVPTGGTPPKIPQPQVQTGETKAGGAGIDIAQVLEAGKGYNVVVEPNGDIVRQEGARNWRNNNPGNIQFREGGFAQKFGAIIGDPRFAIFPSYEAGRAAKEKLLFEGRNYKNLTLKQAIARWAPPNENNTLRYQATVLAAVGGVDKPMSEYSKSEREKILDTMEKVEGYKPGKVVKLGKVGEEIESKYKAVKEGVAQSAAVPRAAEYEPTEKEIEDYMFEARKTEKILTKEEAKKELIAAKKAEKEREVKAKQGKPTSILDLISSPFKAIEDSLDKAMMEVFTNEPAKAGVKDEVDSIDMWSGQDKFNKMLEERKKAEKVLPDLWSGQDNVHQKEAKDPIGGILKNFAEKSKKPGYDLGETKEQTLQERVEEKAKELEKKSENVSEEVAQKEQAVTEQAIASAPMSNMMTTTPSSINSVAIDPWLDSLVDKLFNSIAAVFNDDFKKYPYESNVNHMMNI